MQEDLKRILAEQETAAYALSGQKKVRRAVKTEVGGISRSDDLFRLYEMFKAGDTSVYEEMRENQERERILLKEAAGEFPEWNELSDEKLVKSLVMLNEKERELIYLHVFEERSFKKIGEMTGMTAERCKDAYFYAIRKIRKRLGDKKDEL